MHAQNSDQHAAAWLPHEPLSLINIRSESSSSPPANRNTPITHARRFPCSTSRARHSLLVTHICETTWRHRLCLPYVLSHVISVPALICHQTRYEWCRQLTSIRLDTASTLCSGMIVRSLPTEKRYHNYGLTHMSSNRYKVKR